jgi:UDP-GlcNAc:undecaprenyl-phosphate GlcNAc-1-phosphate transferase
VVEASGDGARLGVLIYVMLMASAAGIVTLLTPLVRGLASHFDIVDEPDEERRVHTGRVPRLGGLAVLVAVLGALCTPWLFGFDALVNLAARHWELHWLLAGTLIATAVGIIDDVWQIGPLPKLAGHTVAAALAIVGGYAIRVVTNPFTGTIIDLGSFGTVVTMFWIVGITNAFNLIDGLDGLAAGVALIAALTVSVLAVAQGRPDAALLATPLAGALLGFLLYNFHPASIFLGDSGAFLLGYVLSVLSIQGLQKGPTVAILLVPVLALGFPIVETLVTIQRRYARSGTIGLLRSDADHIHHRLLMGGMSQRRAVLVLYSVCTALGASACLAVIIGGPGSALAVVVVALACYLGLRRLGYLSAAPP